MGVYDYMNKATASWQMRIGEHDPVNSRTLCVAKGYHATFGAGADTPVKNSGQRGYTFTPLDYMYSDNPVSASNFSLLSAIRLSNSAPNAGILATGNAPAFVQSGLEMNVWSSRIRAGGVMCPAWTQSNTPLGSGNWLIIGLTKNGAAGTFYLNGLQDGTFVAAEPNAKNYMYIGVGQSGTYMNGTMAIAMVFNIALTPTQMNDLSFDVLRRINDV